MQPEAIMNLQLKSLKAGDLVLFYPRSIISEPVHVKVEKVTHDRICVRGVYFDKDKGYACGHGQDPFPPTIIPSRLAKKLLPSAEDVDSKVVTPDAITAAFAEVKAAQEKLEATLVEAVS